MRRAALATLGVVLAALVVWWLAADEERGSARTEPAMEAEIRAPEPAPAELTTVAAPREEAREPSVPDAPIPTTAEAEAPAHGAAPLAAVRLSGTIVVVDEQGREHAGEDGGFSFVLWSGDTGSWHAVTVADGRWSTSLAPEEPLDALALEGVRLGDRAATPEPPWAARFVVSDGSELALRVRWPPRSVLHVRARASGSELAPVLLVEVNDWPARYNGHPGRAAEEARDLGPSPIELPASSTGLVGTRTLYARSPGFAWGRIEIDERSGGERTLELEPAGTLEVRWTGASADPAARLRIFGSGYHPVFEAELANSGVLAEDLAPGTYTVKAQVGEVWREPLVLAQTTAEVVAARHTQVNLSLAEVPVQAHVPLSGTLVVPRAWELADFSLGFGLLDTALAGFEGSFSIERGGMQPLDTSPGAPPSVFAWSAGNVQPGRYEAGLDALGFSVVLVVGPAGLADARIEVPPPAEVRVRCVEASTGLPAVGTFVSWRCKVPEGVRGWSSRHASHEETDSPGVFRCRTPLGPVLFNCSGGGFAWKSVELVVEPGRNEVVLELARVASLAVILRDGATVVPWELDLVPGLSALEGQAESRSWTRAGGEVTLHMSHGGRYMLTIPPIAGYEPSPPTEVELVQGETREHVVELVRR